MLQSQSSNFPSFVLSQIKSSGVQLCESSIKEASYKRRGLFVLRKFHKFSRNKDYTKMTSALHQNRTESSRTKSMANIQPNLLLVQVDFEVFGDVTGKLF